MHKRAVSYAFITLPCRRHTVSTHAVEQMSSGRLCQA